MRMWLVERDLEGVSLDGVGEAKEIATRQVGIMRAKGTAIRYLRSTFLPDDGRCMCMFEAESADDVRKLNDDAGLPYIQVVRAYNLEP